MILDIFPIAQEILYWFIYSVFLTIAIIFIYKNKHRENEHCEVLLFVILSLFICYMISPSLYILLIANMRFNP